jgi:hypothetical protein
MLLQHSLRRRLGNCLLWYSHLRSEAETFVASFISRTPKVSGQSDDAKMDAAGVSDTITEPPLKKARHDVTVGDLQAAKDNVNAAVPPVVNCGVPAQDSDPPCAENMMRQDSGGTSSEPSAYLRRRCPLCFTRKAGTEERGVYVLLVQPAYCKI